MKVSFFIDRPVFSAVISIVIVIVGIIGLTMLPVDQYPQITPPVVKISASYPGASALTVSQAVATPIEQEINGTPGMLYMESNSSNSGGFSATVTFDVSADPDLAAVEIQNRIKLAESRLPAEVIQNGISVEKQAPSQLMTICLTSNDPKFDEIYLSNFATINVLDLLRRIPGVGRVSNIGSRYYAMQIWAMPDKLANFGLTVQDLQNALKDQNRESAAGVLGQQPVQGLDITIPITTQGRLSSAKQFEDIVVRANANGSIIRLRDVARVSLEASSYSTESGINGENAAVLGIYMLPGANAMEVADNVKKAMEEISANFPEGMSYEIPFDMTTYISESIHEVYKTLFEALVLVVLVVFLSLQSWRATLIPVVAVPISLIGTFGFMLIFGFSLNILTLLGLILAIGIVVDDAIVVVENVEHLMETEKLSPYEATKKAMNGLASALIATSLVLCAVFVPVSFLSGITGQLYRQFTITIAVSVLLSTVVALTVTHVLCSYLLGKEKIKDEKHSTGDSPVARKMKEWYGAALAFVLGHKKSVLGGTIGLFAVALACFFTLGRSFLPPFNEGSFTINISSLPGISLEESDKMGHRAEELLLSIPEIQTVARKTGRAELDEHALGVNVSEIEAPFELKDRSRSELVADVREKLGTIVGANVEIGQPISHRIDAMLSGTKANIAIKLFGDDLNRMFTLGNEIKSAIQGIPGIADLNVEQQIERPQLIIAPKREVLAKYGISLPEFSEFVNVCLAGETVSQVYEKGKSFDLTVRVKDDLRDEMEKIRNLMLDTGNGQKIPLNYVAEVRSAMGPNTISRENVKRKIVISANVADRDLRSVVNDIQERVDASVKLPEGYHIEYGGQFESEQAASRTLALTSFMSIVVIFLLLYHEFRSVKESAIILINLPLALIGGVFALLVTTGEVSIPAIIGFISLFGIATRNGMLLISHYNHLQQEEGYGVYDSVIRGSLDRLNPILMTALSSALALIPLALSLPGNEIQSPMAKVILGGLLTSTFLNGFIIPIVYLMMHGKKEEMHP